MEDMLGLITEEMEPEMMFLILKREENGFIDNLDRVYQYQRFRYGKRSAGFLADSFGGFGRYGGFGPKFVEDGGYGFVKRTSGNYGPVRYGKCKMVHN